MSSTPAPASSPSKDAAEDVNELVAEYLDFAGMHETLKAFQRESKTRRARLPELSPGSPMVTKESVKMQLVEAFDSGHRGSLELLWNRHVPTALRDNDKPTNRLWFYLNLHLAVWPHRLALTQSSPQSPTAADAARSMAEFKRFLETKGQALAQTPEFLVYYALPYVQSPLQHPSFRPLFAEAWLLDLRRRFIIFLESVLEGMKVPRLYTVMAASASSPSPLLPRRPPTSTQAALSASRSIVGLAKDLIGAVERMGSSGPLTASGEVGNQVGSMMASLRNAISSQEQHLLAVGGGSQGSPVAEQSLVPAPPEPPSPSLPSTDDRDTGAAAGAGSGSGPSPMSQSSRYSTPRSSLLAAPGALESSGVEPTPPPPAAVPPSHPYAASSTEGIHPPGRAPLASLNYPKIRSDLATYLAQSSSDLSRQTPSPTSESKASRRCCLLLQALRWRLTRSRGGKPRRVVLQLFIDKDVLSVRGAPTPLLHDLLNSMSPLIKESSARLVNAMASSCVGRTYLLQSTTLISNLIRVMSAETGDSLLRQNALGCLQKFSLRRGPQTQIIDARVIHWTVRLLREHILASGGTGRPLSEYSVEYSTALLMNLSLRREGKLRAAAPELEVLEMLSDYLESENEQVRTYVNGTLYSLLALPDLKDRAREMGLGDILRGLMAHSPEQFQLQLEFILEQMEAPPTDDAMASDEEEEDDDDDDGEGEGDEDESFEDEEPEDNDDGIVPVAGEPVGEELLCSAYLADGGAPEAAQVEYQRMQDWQSQASAVPPRARVLVEASPVPQRPITPAKTTGRRHRAAPPQASAVEAVPVDDKVPEPMMSRPRIPRTPPSGAERRTRLSTTSPRIPSSPVHRIGVDSSGEYPFASTERKQYSRDQYYTRDRLPPRVPDGGSLGPHSHSHPHPHPQPQPPKAARGPPISPRTTRGRHIDPDGQHRASSHPDKSRRRAPRQRSKRR